MKPIIVHRRSMHVVGVECCAVDCDCKSDFHVLAWVRLASRMSEIREVLHPNRLYGIWRVPAGEAAPRYLVGVEVEPGTPAPSGLTSLEIPECEAAEVEVEGLPARIPMGWLELNAWIDEQKFPEVHGDAIEIYVADELRQGQVRVGLSRPVGVAPEASRAEPRATQLTSG